MKKIDLHLIVHEISSDITSFVLTRLSWRMKVTGSYQIQRTSIRPKSILCIWKIGTQIWIITVGYHFCLSVRIVAEGGRCIYAWGSRNKGDKALSNSQGRDCSRSSADMTMDRELTVEKGGCVRRRAPGVGCRPQIFPGTGCLTLHTLARKRANEAPRGKNPTINRFAQEQDLGQIEGTFIEKSEDGETDDDDKGWLRTKSKTPEMLS